MSNERQGGKSESLEVSTTNWVVIVLLCLVPAPLVKFLVTGGQPVANQETSLNISPALPELIRRRLYRVIQL